MIVVIILLSIIYQTEYRLARNQEDNCHYDHIPFNLKLIQNSTLIQFIAAYFLLVFLQAIFTLITNGQNICFKRLYIFIYMYIYIHINRTYIFKRLRLTEADRVPINVLKMCWVTLGFMFTRYFSSFDMMLLNLKLRDSSVKSEVSKKTLH